MANKSPPKGRSFGRLFFYILFRGTNFAKGYEWVSAKFCIFLFLTLWPIGKNVKWEKFVMEKTLGPQRKSARYGLEVVFGMINFSHLFKTS